MCISLYMYVIYIHVSIWVHGGGRARFRTVCFWSPLHPAAARSCAFFVRMHEVKAAYMYVFVLVVVHACVGSVWVNLCMCMRM